MRSFEKKSTFGIEGAFAFYGANIPKMISSLNRASFLLILITMFLYGCSIGTQKSIDPNTSPPSPTGTVYYKGDTTIPDAIVLDFEGGLVMTSDFGWVITNESQADTLLSLVMSGYDMEEVVVKNGGKEAAEGVLFIQEEPIPVQKRTYSFSAGPDKRTFRIYETTNSNGRGRGGSS